MVKGRIEPTPEAPNPYRVVVWSNRALVRAEPVESIRQGRRVLARLMQVAREC
jgi:hypothetical protein